MLPLCQMWAWRRRENKVKLVYNLEAFIMNIHFPQWQKDTQPCTSLKLPDSEPFSAFLFRNLQMHEKVGINKNVYILYESMFSFVKVLIERTRTLQLK